MQTREQENFYHAVLDVDEDLAHWVFYRFQDGWSLDKVKNVINRVAGLVARLEDAAKKAELVRISQAMPPREPGNH